MSFIEERHKHNIINCSSRFIARRGKIINLPSFPRSAWECRSRRSRVLNTECYGSKPLPNHGSRQTALHNLHSGGMVGGVYAPGNGTDHPRWLAIPASVGGFKAAWLCDSGKPSALCRPSTATGSLRSQFQVVHRA
jgi:hypothetical protein